MHTPFARLCAAALICAAGCGDAGLPGTSTDTESTPFPDAGIPGAAPDSSDAGYSEPVVTPEADVEVVITSDNAFSFGYGDAQAIATFVEGVPSDAEGIFNCPVGFGPEPYVVPGDQAPASAYLYIIAWADRSFTQGALAQFKRTGGAPIYSGHGAWEVCATGKEYVPNAGPGPDVQTVNHYIAQCNAGAGGDTFSKGWVNPDGAITANARGKLALGERNDSDAGDFPQVCQRDDTGTQGIDAEARWMWFDPEDGSSAFVGNAQNRTQAFLIFRLSAGFLLY